MIDAKSLLDQFLGQQAPDTQPAPGTQPAPSAQTPQAGANPLQSLSIPDSVKGIANAPGALATGALAGGLAGLLLGGKKPKKLAKTALKAGGLALVGGLAYKAYSDWQANKAEAGAPASAPPQTAAPGSPAPTPTVPFPAPTGTQSGLQPQLPPPGTPFNPSAPEEQHRLCTTLIRAMIAAAKADGHISAEERARIAGQIQSAGMDADHRAFIEQELAKPLDIDAVAASAETPEQAVEVYAASLLAIDPNGVAERGYLAMLAARLKLDPDLVAYLHANADAIAEPAPV